MFRIRTAATVTLAAAAILSSAPTAAFAGPSLGVEDVDTVKMSQFIAGQYGGGQVVGYAYAIDKFGQLSRSGGGGAARTAAEGNRGFNPDTRMEIASATKNVTAAAVLSLLEANELTPDTLISPYLPAGWSQGSGWNQLTFRHLLSHTSGLGTQPADANFTPAQSNQWGTLFSGVQFAVSQPVVIRNPLDYDYTNMNYATLRVMLPGLWRTAEPERNVPALTSGNSGQWALNYVNEKLLGPAGIAPTSCVPGNASTAPLAYDVNNTAQSGQLFQLTGANFEACAGHRGLFLSVKELARFQTALRSGLVSPTVRGWMDNGKLGWSPNSNITGREGIFFHAGDLFGSANREQHSCQMKLPNGLEAAVLINSAAPSGASPCAVLINAYNAAIS